MDELRFQPKELDKDVTLLTPSLVMVMDGEEAIGLAVGVKNAYRICAALEQVEVEQACTCRFYDDGGPESGPHLAMEADENCPTHGLKADPEGWGH